MTTSKVYEEAQGTLDASVNGVDSFEAGKVYLTNENEQLTIVGVEESSASPLRIIEMKMAANIANGNYIYPQDPQIRALIAGANLAPAHYVTERGGMTVEFDRENNHYKGRMNFTAKNLFPPRNTIEVVGNFDIHTNASSKQ